jgi:hypothetical protein
MHDGDNDCVLADAFGTGAAHVSDSKP